MCSSTCVLPVPQVVITAIMPRQKVKSFVDAAGSSGNGPGQGATGQQHSQPVPINGGASAKTASHKMLNGNATAFHPSSGTPNGRSMAESPTGPAQPKNGVISYRNAAGERTGCAGFKHPCSSG